MVNFVALGWERSILESSVERICRDFSTTDSADFSDTLFITPTAESGRLLREELAKSFTCGVTNLQVGLPERLFANANQALLSPTLTMHYWIEVLKSINKEELNQLFRFSTEDFKLDSNSILANIAFIIQKCRTTLAGEGLSIEMVCNYLASMEGEQSFDVQERYNAFQSLEATYLKAIPPHLFDSATARLKNIEAPKLEDSIKRVVLIGCMELKGAAVKALQNLQVDIEIWVSVPEEEKTNFDEWGRPLVENYLAKTIDFDLENSLRFLPKPEDQASRIAHELLEMTPADRPALIGILDSEVTDFLLDKCALNNKLPKLYTPQNRPLSGGKLTSLFVHILDFIGNAPPFALVQNLLQNSIMQSWLRREFADAKVSELLSELEKIKNRAVIESWAELERFINPNSLLAKLVVRLNAKRSELRQADNTLKALWGFFAQILESSLLTPTEYSVNKELNTLKQLLVEVINLPINNVLQRVIFLTLLRETNLPSQPNQNGSAEIAGFLELNWRKAEHLLIAGFNEESFNYGNEADIFLPMNLKKELGMLTNDNYYVSDVVRFIQLCRSKKITLLGSRASTQGEIRRPARLLLQTDEQNLAQRCRLLFSNQLNERLVGAQLITTGSGVFPPFMPQFSSLEGPNSMSITGFKSYLACPFRFYREKFLNCREFLTNDHELNPASWGTVIHEILETFGNAKHQDISEEAIYNECLDIAIQVERNHFANPTKGILGFQLELLEDTLKGFARIESNSLHEAWKTVETEFPIKFIWQELYSKLFPNEPPQEWRQAITLRGSIDRIDQCGDNDWRIVDYKTASSATEPKDTHLTKSAPMPIDDEDSKEHENRLAPYDNKEFYWQDLQLPLYLLATKYFYPKVKDPHNDTFSAVYYNLPLAYTGAKVSEFANLNNPELLESAVRCADWVLEQIYCKQIFWPPRETSSYNNNFAKALGEFSVDLFLPKHLWEEQ